MRVGWVVAAREHIEIFRNYSSIGTGGVSRASQLYVTQLLETRRVRQARGATLDRMMRFSFGPLQPDSFEEDIAILRKCV